MAVPKRPKAGARASRPSGPGRPASSGAQAPTGLPSSQHSDTATIVNTIIHGQELGHAAPTQGPRRAHLDELAHRPDNLRQAAEYDPAEDPSIAELAMTIKSAGQLQTVTVVDRDAWLQFHPHHSDALSAATWVVVIGNRRLAAARLAGVPDLRIEVDNELASPDRADKAALIENYHRKGADPIEEAIRFRRLLTEQTSLRELADEIGISHTQIHMRIALLNLLPEFQQLVSQRHLTVQKAQPIARLTEDEQRAALEAGPPYVLPAAEPSAPPRAISIRRGSTPQQIAGDLTTRMAPDALRELIDHLLSTLDTQETTPQTT